MANEWDVITPEAGTNQVLNPVQGTTGNYTAVGGATITQVTTYSYLGSKCLRVQTSADNTGVYVTLAALANAIHYMTLRIHTASDITPMFDCSLDNATYNTPVALQQEGNWYVYGYQFPAAQANASTKLYIQQNGAGANDIFIGHIQVEANTYPTTPITGDLPGFIGGYAWAGAPHASASTRSGQERSGGKVVSLASLNCSVRWSSGIGMPPSTHHTQAQALLPGAQFLGAKVEPRAIDLLTAMGTTPTPAGTHSARKGLVNALKLELVSGAQPVKLRYRGALSTKPVEFNAVYDTGLELNINGEDYEQAGVRLICYDPYGYELGEASVSLTTSQSLTAAYLLSRINGVWTDAYGADAATSNLALSPNGSIYWTGGTWNKGAVVYPAFSYFVTVTGGSAVVTCILFLPDGSFIIGGNFDHIGAVAALNIAKNTAGTWTALASGLDNTVSCLALGHDGKVFAGGAFHQSGATVLNHVGYWDGAAWQPMGSGGTKGVDDEVNCLAVAKAGNLIIGGAFHNAGGSAAAHCVVYTTGGAFAALGSGTSDAVNTIAVSATNQLYFGGEFTTANGVTVNYLARWTGSTFEALGGGVGASVYRLWFESDGLLYIMGNFVTAGGLTVNHQAIWNGTTYGYLDVEFSQATSAVASTTNGNLFIGYMNTGTAVTGYANTVTNSGTARAYPVLTIKRVGGTSARVEYLKNNTTGATIWLNYNLLDGETLTIDFRMGQRKVTSSYWGSVWRAILRGSEITDFYLAPGINSISAFVYPVGSPTVTAAMVYVNTHISADGVAA